MKKHTHYPTGKLKQLQNYTPEERLVILTHLCHELYIARNISSNERVILENLKKIDILFSTGPEDGN
jgi:hypothetical protein